MNFLPYANLLEQVFVVLSGLVYLLPLQKREPIEVVFYPGTHHGGRPHGWTSGGLAAEWFNKLFACGLRFGRYVFCRLLLCLHKKECGFLCCDLVPCDFAVFYEFMACSLSVVSFSQ